MNVFRFVRKCVTDQAAAWQSAKLACRSCYGQAHWALRPQSPLRCRLAGGGVLWLEPGHCFTHAFWPGVDQYEPDVAAALRSFLKRGDTFVDCGANVGYFSALAGGIVGPQGRVVAVEANPLTCRLLQRNLDENRLGQAVHCALTETPGEVELFMPRSRGDAYSSMRKGGLVQGDDIESFRVAGRTLDELVESLGLNAVHVVKIDIEGAELSVLRSARRVMRDLRPIFLCEYGTNTWPAFGASKEDFLTLLIERGYRVGVFDPASCSVQEVEEEVWKMPYANLILQPLEPGASSRVGSSA